MGNPVPAEQWPIPERLRHCEPANQRVSQIASLGTQFAPDPRKNGSTSRT